MSVLRTRDDINKKATILLYSGFLLGSDSPYRGRLGYKLALFNNSARNKEAFAVKLWIFFFEVVSKSVTRVYSRLFACVIAIFYGCKAHSFSDCLVVLFSHCFQLIVSHLFFLFSDTVNILILLLFH